MADQVTRSEKDELIEEIKKLNASIEKLNARYVPLRVFFNGILTAIGTFIGATVVVGLIVYLLSQIPLIPILGNVLADLVAEILRYLPNRSGNLFF